MTWIIEAVFIFFDALFNRYRIANLKPGKTLNHTVNVAYRAAFGLCEIEFGKIHGLQLVMYALGSFIAFRLLFNIELNLLKHKPIDAAGKTSTIDRFTRWTGIPWEVDTIWSVILASGFIYGYYHTNLL